MNSRILKIGGISSKTIAIATNGDIYPCYRLCDYAVSGL